MADREVTIKISAKNLTEAEFRKVRQGLGGLGNSAKGATQKTTGLQRAFSSFGKAAPGALKIVAVGAAAAGAAIAGIATAVFKLGQRGTELQAISASFKSLTAAVGESGQTMVATTRTATKGLITDLDVMAAANKGLLLGLPITSDSMGELASTSIVLGKAMGQGAGKSLDDLITALGRSSPLILDNLGLTVKVGDANEAYAKKLGKSTAELTEAEKKTAFYEAALEAARAKVEEIGGVQLTFGDHIQRAKVFVTNLVDSLSMMIAKSPPLLAGMQAVGSAVTAAFGGNQEGLILGIVNVIEKAAIITLEFAKTGITAAEFLYRGFQGIKLVVMGLAIALTETNKRTMGFLATTLEAAANIPGVGVAFKLQATAARAAADALEYVNTGLKEQIGETAIAAAGMDSFSRGLDAAKTAVDTIQGAVINAGLSQRESNTATAEGTVLIGAHATASEESGARIKAACEEWGLKFREELEETGIKTKQWAEDEKTFLQELAGEQGFVGLGNSIVGVGDIVAFQTQAMADSFAFFGIQTKDEMRATYEEAKKHFKKIKDSGEKTAKELEKIWKEYEESRRTTSGETEAFTTTSNEAIMTGTIRMLQTLGTKSKAAAYAGAVIGTARAVVQALQSSPPPGSWILAAINAAMGAVQIAAISRQKPYRMGTAGLDYQNFGTESLATLHGREAIIPAGGGHKLAEEISGALARTGGTPRDTDIIVERFERIGSKLDTLPRAIQRAVRDGMLLAAS